MQHSLCRPQRPERVCTRSSGRRQADDQQAASSSTATATVTDPWPVLILPGMSVRLLAAALVEPSRGRWFHCSHLRSRPHEWAHQSALPLSLSVSPSPAGGGWFWLTAATNCWPLRSRRRSRSATGAQSTGEGFGPLTPMQPDCLPQRWAEIKCTVLCRDAALAGHHFEKRAIIFEELSVPNARHRGSIFIPLRFSFLCLLCPSISCRAAPSAGPIWGRCLPPGREGGDLGETRGA